MCQTFVAFDQKTPKRATDPKVGSHTMNNKHGPKMGKIEDNVEDSLMTAEGELSDTLRQAVTAAFRRFAQGGKMHRPQADAFFNAVNKTTTGAPEDEWDQLVMAFAEEEKDAEGSFLLLEGFLNL